MTNHPITPPTELVKKWINMFEFHLDAVVLTEAAQWGSDQELEACCEWLDFYAAASEAKELRADRRPKLPSLKERLSKAIIDGDEREALKLLEELDDSFLAHRLEHH